eukprot:TRINITY_DN7110_c0_g1_i2.p1 TRINITY_DN7110_c0_g1~~TRINITY_DN7110_c0_g1_i2.p1  ORF type:complete len:254 (+),score=51.42 TRINITY_DN7110_c0_g1_i2:60-764(+)
MCIRDSSRITPIIETSKRLRVTVHIDAEQTYLQPAIDLLAQQYQQKYNKDSVLVFNTIQNYLKSSKARVEAELERCEALELPLALKMVRGAYMKEEKQLAVSKGVETPVFATFEETEKNFHENLTKVLKAMTPKCRVFVGTHNVRTVQHVESIIASSSSFLREGVTFGQINALGDHLTHAQRAKGFNTIRSIPWGQMDVMVPYLLRRAEEGGNKVDSMKLQAALIRNEIIRRMV